MADTLKQQITVITTRNEEYPIINASIDSTKTVLSVIVCNVDTDDTTFDMFVYGNPPGAGGTNNYRIYNAQSLPAKSTFIHNSKLVMRPNDKLVWNQKESTTANPVHVTVSWLDQTS